MNGIFVTGTDTNVGKTWVGTHIISAMVEKNQNIIVRKPIESGWDGDNVESTDTYLLAEAANQRERLSEICPNRFSRPISPVRAASLEGQKLRIKSIANQCIRDYKPNDFLYVEGAGGFYSPLCDDGLNADLAIELNLPILLVAENRLGCINQVLLNVEAIKNRGLELKAVILNNISGEDASEMNNAEDLIGMLDSPVLETHFNKAQIDVIERIIFLINPK